MRVFGYVCSPLCKARAEAEKINIPVYAGQSAVAEARFWRKTGAVFGALAVLVVLALGFWIWYAWFGSVPHPAFSLRFENDPAFSGASKSGWQGPNCFPARRHAGALRPQDQKTNLVAGTGHQTAGRGRLRAGKRRPRVPAGKKFRQSAPDENQTSLTQRELAAELQLHVSGQNIWVCLAQANSRITIGTPARCMQEIPLAYGPGEFDCRKATRWFWSRK